MKLNLGCGTDYTDGWCNADIGNCRKDLHMDMESFPWPISDNTVEQILMKHVLEHAHKETFVQILREIYRVCKNDAIVHIEVPAAGSNNFWTDPTHNLPVTLRTFDYFDSQKALSENGRIYGWGDIDLTVLEASEIPNPPNGPDLKFALRVNK